MGPIVETSNGKVAGASANGAAVFRGLRYGDSTAGAGTRFMPPRRPRAWPGVQEAPDLGRLGPATAATGEYGWIHISSATPRLAANASMGVR